MSLLKKLLYAAILTLNLWVGAFFLLNGDRSSSPVVSVSRHTANRSGGHRTEDSWRDFVDDVKQRTPATVTWFEEREGSEKLSMTVVRSHPPGKLVIRQTISIPRSGYFLGYEDTTLFECNFYESGGQWHYEGATSPGTVNEMWWAPINHLFRDHND